MNIVNYYFAKLAFPITKQKIKYKILVFIYKTI